MKSHVVLDYNEGRQGTDLSDQLSAYYPCFRRSIKWYRKVAFELIFGTALVKELFDIQGKLHEKQSDHSTVSRKSCPVFTAWHANREAETWSKTTISKSFEAQTR